VAVLLLAFLVSRSCGSNDPQVSSEEAIEIARGEIAFEATGVRIVNAPRSLDQYRVWVVALFTGTATAPENCRQVEIDARTGDVVAVRRCV
jgi:hypothetical protein